ncbi:MAG TPA: hypothetical protein VI362_03395 [Ignavibacteriaceae bacterium]|nr:hypothetical protein [Ignavibacteriaceae bacterium]
MKVWCRATRDSLLSAAGFFNYKFVRSHLTQKAANHTGLIPLWQIPEE